MCFAFVVEILKIEVRSLDFLQDYWIIIMVE